MFPYLNLSSKTNILRSQVRAWSLKMIDSSRSYLKGISKKSSKAYSDKVSFFQNNKRCPTQCSTGRPLFTSITRTIWIRSFNSRPRTTRPWSSMKLSNNPTIAWGCKLRSSRAMVVCQRSASISKTNFSNTNGEHHMTQSKELISLGTIPPLSSLKKKRSSRKFFKCGTAASAEANKSQRTL